MSVKTSPLTFILEEIPESDNTTLISSQDVVIKILENQKKFI